MTPRDADPLRPPDTDDDPDEAMWAWSGVCTCGAGGNGGPHHRRLCAEWSPYSSYVHRQHRAITVLAILAGFAILLLAYISYSALRSPSAAADPARAASGAPSTSSGVSAHGLGRPAPAELVSPTSGTVAPLCKPSPCPTLTSRPLRHSVDGTASWFVAPDGQAAAGPGLRQALGAGWRGTRVRVCAGRCIAVRLSDFCRCPNGKVIDLDDGLFARLAPLGRGLVAVRVSW